MTILRGSLLSRVGTSSEESGAASGDPMGLGGLSGRSSSIGINLTQQEYIAEPNHKRLPDSAF